MRRISYNIVYVRDVQLEA